MFSLTKAMHKYLPAPFALLLFLSCQNIGSKPRQQNVMSAADYTKPDSLSSATNAFASENSIAPELLEGKTMLTGTYRLWEDADDPTLLIDTTWLEIFAKGEDVDIKPLSFLIENGFDDCAGVNTKSIKTENKTILFIQPGRLKAGIKSAVSISKELLWPGVNTTFKCHGVEYTLAGKGTINGSETYTDDADQTYAFHSVSNYSLQLTGPQGNIFTLVDEESFNDTFIELLFVGDLDGDNLPDFIISAPRHYEEERTLLILSTDISNGRVKAYEAARQFDC